MTEDMTTFDELQAYRKELIERINYELDAGEEVKKALRLYSVLQPDMFEFSEKFMSGVFEYIEKREMELRIDLEKVAQSIKFYRCRDCDNENTVVCDRCEGPDDLGVKPSNWKPKDVPMDCDEGKICPKCGKVMILCEDEKTYHQIWECDGCGYKEDE